MLILDKSNDINITPVHYTDNYFQIFFAFQINQTVRFYLHIF